MQSNDYFNKKPFNTFPFHTFLQVVDKLAYLDEESSPYEVSPGTELCVSDTYYSLGFLVYLHAFGKVTKKGNKWKLSSTEDFSSKKPYRFSLIEDVVKILIALKDGHNDIEALQTTLPELSADTINNYLNILVLLSQTGLVKQHEEGWDATFSLVKWT